MNRRDFLRLSTATGLLPLGSGVWAATADGGPQRLIVVFLRGAIDGLNVVVPYGEQAYYEARPTIAIGHPGRNDGALLLDGQFGLHPALVSLMPLWNEKKLAFIHAAGSPDPTRSHFDAQLFIENGTPGRGTTPDGWMNRLLASLPAPHGPTDAVSIGPTLPQILKGRLPVANLPLGPQAAKPMPLDRPEVSNAFDRLYAGNDAMAKAYREGRAARTELIGDLASETAQADNGETHASDLPLPALAAGTPTSTRAITRASSATICGRWAMGSRLWPRGLARIGPTRLLSSFPSSAARCTRMVMAGPITVTAMSSGFWAEGCAAAGSMATGPGSRRLNFTRAAISPSPPTIASHLRPFSNAICASTTNSSRKSSPECRQHRPTWGRCWPLD
jgi:hypothetical protein